MADIPGRCTNFGNCDIADEKKPVAAPENDFHCPECGNTLTKVGKQRKPLPKGLIAAGGGALVIIAGVLAVFLFYDPSPPPPAPVPTTTAVESGQVMSHLTEGDFSAAVGLLQSSQAQVPALSALRRQIQTPTHLGIRFQYKEAGQPNPSTLTIESSRRLTVTLTHRDNYRIYLSNPTSRDLYVYAFQKDHYGKIHRIFPDPVYSGTGNPLGAGRTGRLPPGDKDWLYLDELSTAESGPIPETVRVAASPWPAEDIKRLYGRIHGTTQGEERRELMRKFEERLKARDDPSVPASFYREFSFMHDR